jgi:hypothetical protein
MHLQGGNIIRVRGRTPKEENMKTITLCGETIKVNQREEKLVRIIKCDAERVLEYYHKNKFDYKTYDRILNEITDYITALFFMDVLGNHNAYDLELIKADEEFLEYMLGENWHEIYE